MNRSKLNKIFSIIICSILVVVLLFTLLASAFAATLEKQEFIPFKADNGAIVEHRTDCLDEFYRGIELYATVETMSPTDNAEFFAGMKNYLPEGYTLDAVFSYAVLTSEAYEKFGVAADELVNPGVFSAETVVYIPIPAEMSDYKYLDVMYASFSAAPVKANAERVKIDGKEYLKSSGTSIGYLGLCHGLDESGNPVMLKFYEKGLLGSIYSFVSNLWGLLFLIVMGVIYIIWFFKPNTPRAPKPAAGGDDSSPLEVTAEISEEASADGVAEEPKQAAPVEEPAADGKAEEPKQAAPAEEPAADGVAEEPKQAAPAEEPAADGNAE